VSAGVAPAEHGIFLRNQFRKLSLLTKPIDNKLIGLYDSLTPKSERLLIKERVGLRTKSGSLEIDWKSGAGLRFRAILSYARGR